MSILGQIFSNFIFYSMITLLFFKLRQPLRSVLFNNTLQLWKQWSKEAVIFIYLVSPFFTSQIFVWKCNILFYTYSYTSKPWFFSALFNGEWWYLKFLTFYEILTRTELIDMKQWRCQGKENPSKSVWRIYSHIYSYAPEMFQNEQSEIL